MNTDINMWQDVCRTCLKTDKNALNLFQNYKNNKLISELLIETVTIQIQENDCLPMNICSDCLEKLNIADDFKTMALKCNTKLHQLRMSKGTAEKPINMLNSDPDIEECSIFIDRKAIDLKCDDFGDNLTKIYKESNYQNEINFVEWKYQERDIKLEDSDIDNENNPLCDLNSNCNEDLKQDNSQIEDETISDEQNTEIKEDDHKMDSTFKSLLSEYDHLKATLTKAEKSKMKLQCKICNKTVGFQYYFSIHLREHIGELPFECDICKKRFPAQFILRGHKQIHSVNRPFKCEICGTAFKKNNALLKHKIVHRTDHPYKCKICNKTFKLEYYLKNHLKIHEKDPEKLYVCEICGRSFATSKDAYIHKTLHNPVDSFPCSKCEKTFKNKNLLSQHVKSHSDVKSYVCSYCGKGFKRQQALLRHTRIHTGEKPYSCKVCGKLFLDSSAIPRHMRIHTGEQPYNCPQCSKMFKYSYELKNHMQSSHPDKDN